MLMATLSISLGQNVVNSTTLTVNNIGFTYTDSTDLGGGNYMDMLSGDDNDSLYVSGTPIAATFSGVDWNGNSFSGVYANTTFYVNNQTPASPTLGASSFVLFGVTYNFQSSSDTYSVDTSGVVTRSQSDSYQSSEGDYLTISMTSTVGGSGAGLPMVSGWSAVDGTIAGFLVQGNLDVNKSNRTMPIGVSPTYSMLGDNYYFATGSDSFSLDGQGNFIDARSDTFNGMNSGGYFTIFYLPGSTTAGTISNGWDPITNQSFEGVLQNGNFYINITSTPAYNLGSPAINGQMFNFLSGRVETHFDSSQNVVTTPISDTYSDGNGGSFTITYTSSNTDGTVSGSANNIGGINGYFKNGTLYLDTVFSPGGYSAQSNYSVYGRTYNFDRSNVSLQLDGSGNVISIPVSDSYTDGNGGGFTITYTQGNYQGTVSGWDESNTSISGTYSYGTLNGNIQTTSYPQGNWYVNALEKTYVFSSGTAQYSLDKIAPSVSDTYVVPNSGSSFTIYYNPGESNGTISGNDEFYGSTSGYYINGSSYLNVVLSPYASFNPFYIYGKPYYFTSGSVNLSFDSSGNLISIPASDNYRDSNGGSFSISYNSSYGSNYFGTVSGSDESLGAINGYYSNGSIYLDVLTSTSSPSSFYVNGKTYYFNHGNAYLSQDGYGNVTTIPVSDTYTDGYGGSFSISYPSGYGSGSVNGSDESGMSIYGYMSGGSLYQNSSSSSSSPLIGSYSYTLFGNTFQYTPPSYAWTNYDSSGNSNSGSIDCYTSSNSGWFDLLYSSDSSTSYTFWGVDPNFGSFSGAFYSGNFTFDSRSSASFAPNQLWVNGTLVNWVWAAADGSGNVTDYYTGSDAAGTVSVSISGYLSGYFTGGYSANVYITASSNSAMGSVTNYMFSVSGWDIETSRPIRGSPVLSANTSYWVNGSEYDWSAGYDDSSGNHIDTYFNSSFGLLTIAGNDSSSASVIVNYPQGPYNGSYANGIFSVGDLDIQSFAPVAGPLAFWINGVYYVRGNIYENTYAGPNGQVLTISGTSDNIALSGSDGSNDFTGTYQGTGGVFIVGFSNGVYLPACPANADGSLQLAAAAPPSQYPPAISVPGYAVWQFLGTAPNDLNPSLTAAYYGNAAATGSTNSAPQNKMFLKIDTDGSGLVTLTDYSTQTSKTGHYEIEAPHLFQSSTDHRLPMPLLAVDPFQNNTIWDPLSNPSGRPATVLVGGEVWRYHGTDGNGVATYTGYYDGQSLTLGAPGRDGGQAVALNNPLGTNYQGTYLNGTFNVIKVPHLEVVTGNSTGGHVAATGLGLQSINGDLDILGNILSMGSLTGIQNTAGLTVGFSDILNSTSGIRSATVQFGVGRQNSNWLWSRATTDGSMSSVPMMKLDSQHQLMLYSPSDPNVPAVTISPTGESSFNGPVHLKPQGDLGMGAFGQSQQ